jgi:hypothetical protein
MSSPEGSVVELDHLPLTAGRDIPSADQVELLTIKIRRPLAEYSLTCIGSFNRLVVVFVAYRVR